MIVPKVTSVVLLPSEQSPEERRIAELELRISILRDLLYITGRSNACDRIGRSKKPLPYKIKE